MEEIHGGGGGGGGVKGWERVLMVEIEGGGDPCHAHTLYLPPSDVSQLSYLEDAPRDLALSQTGPV